MSYNVLVKKKLAPVGALVQLVDNYKLLHLSNYRSVDKCRFLCGYLFFRKRLQKRFCTLFKCNKGCRKFLFYFKQKKLHRKSMQSG